MSNTGKGKRSKGVTPKENIPYR